MTPLVLTLFGDDRPGLVNAASAAVAAHNGTWLESRAARLSGKFAGIVQIAAPEADVEALVAALRGLESAGLKVTVERGVGSEHPIVAGEPLEIEIFGNDRPGIVRDLTRTLAAMGANIEEFSSGIESAAFTGVDMFRASVRVRLPAGLAASEVRSRLEKLAGEIMVDLTLGGEAA